MALPYPMSPVSPFDVITSQAENEKIANIESLADGTGIDDGAITAPKIGYPTFPQKKITSKFTLTGGSTNSATYVPVPNNDTTVVIDKKFSTSKLLVSLGASFFITGTTGEARFGVRIGATDYPISKLFKNETGSGEYMSGEIEITDVTATGNVTVQFIVNVGSGATTLNFGATNSMYLKVEEVPA